MTVKAAASDAILQGVRSVGPGQWIKVVASKRQPTHSPALTSAAASSKPDLKPATAATGRGQGNSLDPALAKAVAGTWAVTVTAGGNPTVSECAFAVEGTALTGTCNSRGAEADLTGEVAGNDISFRYALTYQGATLDFVYSGTIDPVLRTMKGTVAVFGLTGEFTGKKK
jgi:hypothetical protein